MDHELGQQFTMCIGNDCVACMAPVGCAEVSRVSVLETEHTERCTTRNETQSAVHAPYVQGGFERSDALAFLEHTWSTHLMHC